MSRRLFVHAIERYRSWRVARQMAQLRALEQEMGRYTMYGSGPFGRSCSAWQKKQIEIACLRQDLGLPQETNCAIAPVLRMYGVKV